MKADPSTKPEVVSNAGPLMVLAKLRLLYLLKAFYRRVRFAQSVYDEAVTEGLRQGYKDARALFLFLEQTRWAPDEVPLSEVPTILQEAPLDRGERDTLVLAVALGKQPVLMDEVVGRKIARKLGLYVRGSLGILIEAYRQGLIDADQLRLALIEIAQRNDIWVNPALVERLLHEVLGG